MKYIILAALIGCNQISDQNVSRETEIKKDHMSEFDYCFLVEKLGCDTRDMRLEEGTSITTCHFFVDGPKMKMDGSNIIWPEKYFPKFFNTKINDHVEIPQDYDIGLYKEFNAQVSCLIDGEGPYNCLNDHLTLITVNPKIVDNFFKNFSSCLAR
jgi:hypothetical protein